jgi:hypothetical protein
MYPETRVSFVTCPNVNAKVIQAFKVLNVKGSSSKNMFELHNSALSYLFSKVIEKPSVNLKTQLDKKLE